MSSLHVMSCQMYQVLQALARDYSERSEAHEVSKGGHMKGVHMDSLDLLWGRLAVQMMRNSTASFASHVFRVSKQSREESLQTDEAVRQQFIVEEDSKRHREEVGIGDQ